MLACLATAVHVRAQAGTGTLSGTVVDEQGAAVPGANVTATETFSLITAVLLVAFRLGSVDNFNKRKRTCTAQHTGEASMKKRMGLLSSLLAKILSGLAMACVVLVVPLYGQVERASIVGTVTDSSGGAMPGVQVEVINEATNTTTRLVTDSAGSYSAVNLIPGSYTVGASLQGFQPKTFRNYVLQVSQRARLDITLAVGGLEQAIDVTAVAPLLQTENATIGQVISSEAVNALPLNGRNFVQLAILAPGVSGLDYAQQNTINSGRRPDELRPGGTTLQANGASSFSNQVLIDGIDNTEMISQTFVVRPAVEGIQEFKVITNNAGAEYRPLGGRSGRDHDEVGRQQLSWVCVRVLPEQRTGRQELLRKSGF